MISTNSINIPLVFIPITHYCKLHVDGDRLPCFPCFSLFSSKCSSPFNRKCSNPITPMHQPKQPMQGSQTRNPSSLAPISVTTFHVLIPSMPIEPPSEVSADNLFGSLIQALFQTTVDDSYNKVNTS